MSATLTAEEIRAVAAALDGGFALPGDFQMPTVGEIEQELALGDPSWQSLIRSQLDSVHEIVSAHLRGCSVGDGLAVKVAAHVARALKRSPNVLASSSGRLELHIALFRMLVEAGYQQHSAEMSAGLLEELAASMSAGI